MKVYDECISIIEADLNSHIKVNRLNYLFNKQSIDFCNWVQIEGWQYCVDGMYHKQEISKTVMVSPEDLLKIYLQKKIKL